MIHCATLYKLLKRKTEKNTFDAIEIEYFDQPASDF